MDGNGVEDEHGTGSDCWENGSGGYVASADGSNCDHWHSDCSLQRSSNWRRSWEQRILQCCVVTGSDGGGWWAGKAVWLG